MSASDARPLSSHPAAAPAAVRSLPWEGTAPTHSWTTDDLVQRLRAAGRQPTGSKRASRLGAHPLPSRQQLLGMTADLRAALFPLHFGPASLTGENVDGFVGLTLHVALRNLEEQVRRGLHFACDRDDAACPRCQRQAVQAVAEFGASLPDIRGMLENDVRAAFDGDPAAASADEALLCYPGVAAITQHRFAHRLHQLGVPLVPRIISELSHSATGIDIHPGADIGGSFFIDHGTGVVIGETCLIGERVRIYQGVTLGAKSFAVDDEGRIVKGVTRHPVVEDDVVIYAGATILGRITIGRGSIVGGNVWLTTSVPPRSRITQAQAQSAGFEGGAGI